MKLKIRTEIAQCSLMQEIKGSVSLTDNDWFEFLSNQPGIDVKRDVGSKTTYGFGKEARLRKKCLTLLGAQNEGLYRRQG